MQIGHGHRDMMGHVDADLLHHGDGEGVRLAGAHAGGFHIDAIAGEIFEDGRRHRRADGIAATGEEDRAW